MRQVNCKYSHYARARIIRYWRFYLGWLPDPDFEHRFYGRLRNVRSTVYTSNRSIGIRKFRRNWKRKLFETIQLTDLSTWMTPSANESTRCLLSKRGDGSICSSLFLLYCYRHLPDNTRDYSSRIENPLTSARTRNETFLRRIWTINRSIILQTVWRQFKIEMISNKIRVWILVY